MQGLNRQCGIVIPKIGRTCLLILVSVLFAIAAYHSTAAARSPETSIRYDDVPDYLEMKGGRISIRQESSLILDGHPIRLHFVVAKPPGNGPSPLVVFNHGSTGRGFHPERFRRVLFYPRLQDFFSKRGWMSVFFHRRGRGWSDGWTGEELKHYRSRTRAFFTRKSAIRRGLTDIEAGMELLKTWSEVDTSRILIGGVSEGGMLSVAYAGEHPEEISGVLNFVGGVDCARCPNSKTNNYRTARMGSPFPRPMLWLYGGKDRYYNLSYSRKMFGKFTHDGGTGIFAPFPNAGHSLLRKADWEPVVAEYLAFLGFQEFRSSEPSSGTGGQPG